MKGIGFGLERIAWLAFDRPRLGLAALAIVIALAGFGITHIRFDENLRDIFAGNSAAFQQLRGGDRAIRRSGERAARPRRGRRSRQARDLQQAPGSSVRAPGDRRRRQRLLAVRAARPARRQRRRDASRQRSFHRADPGAGRAHPRPSDPRLEAPVGRRQGDDVHGHAERAEGAAVGRPRIDRRDSEDRRRRSRRHRRQGDGDRLRGRPRHHLRDHPARPDRPQRRSAR